MITVFAVELSIMFGGSILFAGLYAWRSPWEASPIGRHLMAFGLAGAFEALLFLLGFLGVRVPVWLFAVAFGLLDVVVVQRLLLLLRAQRQRTGAAHPQSDESRRE